MGEPIIGHSVQSNNDQSDIRLTLSVSHVARAVVVVRCRLCPRERARDVRHERDGERRCERAVTRVVRVEREENEDDDDEDDGD